jgi:hypothetical protein
MKEEMIREAPVEREGWRWTGFGYEAKVGHIEMLVTGGDGRWRYRLYGGLGYNRITFGGWYDTAEQALAAAEEALTEVAGDIVTWLGRRGK